VSPPVAQGSREKRIEWNWLLRCLGLARPDNLQDDGAGHADLILDEIDIRPFESEQFACPQSSNNIEQDHGSLSDIEGAEQRLDFCDFEYRRDLLPFGTLPYLLIRVAIKQFVPQAVVEEDAHHVADLCAARTRQRQRAEPELDLACANMRQSVVTPSRNDPLAQVPSIAQLCRVRFPSAVGGKLMLRAVISQLRENERLPFAAKICHVDLPAQRADCAYGCIFVPKLENRSDNHSAMFAPVVRTRLSPPVFPNVGTAPTLASHDAAVLHGLTSDSILACKTGLVCTLQAQSRHKF
jgi:hypothetical protein